MKKKTVISFTSLPMRAPTHTAIVWWLLLDRLNAPAWAYGVMWTVVGILLIGFIVEAATADRKNVPGFGEQG
jgi:hypothetical protein